MSHYQRNPGRVRIRLAAVLLRDLGVVVDPGDIWCQEGGYRSHYWGLARWGARNVTWHPDWKGPKPYFYSIHSWDTMTECARNGVGFVYTPGEWEADAQLSARSKPNPF